MRTNDLTIEYENRAESLRISFKTISGGITDKNAEYLKNSVIMFLRTQGRGVRSMEIDLGPIEVMDSCGLAALIKIQDEISKREGRVYLSNVPLAVTSLLEITHCEKLFQVKEPSLA